MSSPTPKRQAVVVGLFVAFGVAILAGGILTVGDLNDAFTRKVTVHAVFDQVSGLQQGDNIWYSGVKVGTVKSLTFEGQFRVQVEMKIDQDATRFIHDDALAKIGSDGLIGNTIVVLYGGTDKAAVLKEGDVLKTGKTVSAEDIMTMVQQNNTNLLAITTDLMEVSENLVMGEGTVGKLLQDDSLYLDVTTTVASLNTAATNAGTLTDSLSVFAAKLNRDGGLPNDLVTDRTTYASLTATVDHLAATSARASVLVDGLAVGAADPDTMVGVVLHDEVAGANLKATLSNLKDGSVLLNEDLEAAQHNVLLRGFFRRKAKQADKEDTPAE